jgi:hypothetical protein
MAIGFYVFIVAAILLMLSGRRNIRKKEAEITHRDLSTERVTGQKAITAGQAKIVLAVISFIIALGFLVFSIIRLIDPSILYSIGL